MTTLAALLLLHELEETNDIKILFQQ